MDLMRRLVCERTIGNGLACGNYLICLLQRLGDFGSIKDLHNDLTRVFENTKLKEAQIWIGASTLVAFNWTALWQCTKHKNTCHNSYGFCFIILWSEYFFSNLLIAIEWYSPVFCPACHNFSTNPNP